MLTVKMLAPFRGLRMIPQWHGGPRTQVHIQGRVLPKSRQASGRIHTVPGMLPIMLRRFLTILLAACSLSACNGDIYLRNGVTNGDTFYLNQRAMSDPDPALKSWVTYSLARSTCQLQLDEKNPARASSFECELTARRLLVDAWSAKTDLDSSLTDRYLDELTLVNDAGYLPDYVAVYFKQRHWKIPAEVSTRDFRAWERRNLPRHKSETVLTGSWNYASRVNPPLQADP